MYSFKAVAYFSHLTWSGAENEGMLKGMEIEEVGLDCRVCGSDFSFAFLPLLIFQQTFMLAKATGSDSFNPLSNSGSALVFPVGKALGCFIPIASQYPSIAERCFTSAYGDQVISPVAHNISNEASVPFPIWDKIRSTAHSFGFTPNPGIWCICLPGNLRSSFGKWGRSNDAWKTS
jgi:hypothetical protein